MLTGEVCAIRKNRISKLIRINVYPLEVINKYSILRGFLGGGGILVKILLRISYIFIYNGQYACISMHCYEIFVTL